MSKEGCLARIAKYEKAGLLDRVETEKAFYAEHYGKLDADEKPKKSKK